MDKNLLFLRLGMLERVTMFWCEVTFSDVVSGKSNHLFSFILLRRLLISFYIILYIFCCFIGFFFHKSDIAFIQLLLGYFIRLIPIADVAFKRVVWEWVQVYRKIEQKSQYSNIPHRALLIAPIF